MGIVALKTRARPFTSPAATNARSCNGVVNSHARWTPSDLAIFIAPAMSPGSAGLVGNNLAPHRSGNTIVVSSPYMCCGATVPMTTPSAGSGPSA